MSCERGSATLSRLLLRDAINNNWELNSKSCSANKLVDYYGSLSLYGRSDSGFHSDSALSSPSPIRWKHNHKILPAALLRMSIRLKCKYSHLNFRAIASGKKTRRFWFFCFSLFSFDFVEKVKKFSLK